MADVVRLFQPVEAAVVRQLFGPDERITDLIPGGEDISTDLRFGDDIWDLAGHRAWRDKAGTETKLNFTSLPARWREAAKELALLQMNPPLAPDRAPGNAMAMHWPHVQEPIVPVTAQGNLKALRLALRAVEKNAIVAFDSDDWQRLTILLTQPADVEDKRSGAVLSPAVSKGRAQQLYVLWQVSQITGREELLGRGLPFDGRDINSLFTGRGKLNSVRPHETVGHVLGYTAWVFDHIAADIVDHIEWWAANTADEPPLSRESLREDMLDLATGIAERTGGLLPGSRNVNGGLTVAHAPLARLLAVYDSDEAFDAGRWVMSQLRGHVELSEACTPCPLPITAVPTSSGELRPWTPRLLASNTSLDIWQRRLVYAAMYYISATVMLRDSQLAMLPMNGLTIEEKQRPDSTSYTHRKLKAFKTKNRHAPVATTVTVNSRIAQIVDLMHRLQRILGYQPALHPQTGLPYLFDQRLAVPSGKTPRIDSRDGLYLDLSFVKVMQEGAKELHERGVIGRDLTDSQLNMRQVRITCAQAYAVREHGQALAAAFGRWDMARVVAGYVGDVYKLITPLEPEDTIDIARRDKGRRIVRTARDRDTLTGNGVPRFETVIDASGAVLSNPAPLTPARLANLGKKNQNIEQGPLTLCIYQQEGALCDGKGKPDFRLCLPGQCRNSVMTRADRARYELMRRQHLERPTEIGRRAADRMDDANPGIRTEFQDHSNDDLSQIIVEHMDDYIRAELEGNA